MLFCHCTKLLMEVLVICLENKMSSSDAWREGFFHS